MTLILPGDKLNIQDISDYKTTIGPGIYKYPKVVFNTDVLIPSQAGILEVSKDEFKHKQLIYIESNSKRYIPHMNDFVIGVIVGSVGEFYKVQLQEFSPPVLLNFMAFPNASKKNRPNLKVGQCVYARVSIDSVEIENEIECIDPNTGKEGGFGLLDESGYVFNVNLNFARELLYNPNSVALQMVANKCQFEIAIGINGKIWLKCGEGVKNKVDEGETLNDDDMEVDSTNVKDLKYTLASADFLIKCQHLQPDQWKSALNQSFRNV